MSQEPERIRNYINGEWVASRGRKRIPVTNPATGETIAYAPSSTRREVDAAVEAAREAFPGWRATPLKKRIEHLTRLERFLEVNKDALAHLIVKEHGKTYKEALGEMTRVLENMEQVHNPNLMQSPYFPNLATGIESLSRRMPVGVFCAITPFNFPAMIPFWSFPYALYTGNTFIIKPSEQTPLTMTRVFEIIRDYAGLPPGVINLVHGGEAVTNRLITHPDVVGVSSVTSTPVMKAIWRKAALAGKERVNCGGGAKNPVVVTSDVDQIITVPHIIESVFGNTGQRCLAGSNVVLVGNKDFHDEMVEKLIVAARQIRVGAGNRQGVTMGPVISQNTKERIVTYIERGIAEGAQLVLDGRNVEPDGDPRGYWLGPTIFTGVTPEMTIAQDEIFGPVMPVIHMQNVEEAIQMIDDSPYGNAAMIFTRDRRVEERFEADDVEVGNLGEDVPLPAPVPPLPFGGMGDSFRGILHGQGVDSILFFTREKIITRRRL